MVDVAQVEQERERRAVASIRSAFPIGDPPTSSEMRNDHCDECSETSTTFAGRRWDEITVADLAHNPGVSLLTATGFRYYLPAPMLRCIEAPKDVDCVPLSLLGCLSPPGGRPDAKLAGLSRSLDQAQVAAVHAFLLVLEAREKIDLYAPEAFEHVPASKALARAIAYWGEQP